MESSTSWRRSQRPVSVHRHSSLHSNCSALIRAALLETAMFRYNTLTAAINSLLIGPVGIHLSYSGYIIASS